MPKGKRWNITTSGDRSIKEIQKELKGEGFSVDQVHEEVGGHNRRPRDAVAKKLKGIKGVSDVSPEKRASTLGHRTRRSRGEPTDAPGCFLLLSV